MVILCVGLSFSSNTGNIIKKYYQSSVEPVTVNYNNYGWSEDSEGVFDRAAYQNINSILEENKEIIGYSKYEYNNYQSTVAVQEHKFPIVEHIEIIEGSNVNASHSNTNKVLVSALFAQNYYEKNGVVLKPGSIFDYLFEYNIMKENYRQEEANKKLSLEVVGIYKLADAEKKSYEANIISNNDDIIIDAGYLINNTDNLIFTSVTYYYNVTQTNFNSDELVDKLDLLVESLNATLPRESKRYDSTSSSALADLSMSKILGTAIIAVAVFLGLILILLSIGSLANTIMISVDKNKKFIGLLKALGLNEKDLKSTIKMESITTIVLGVMLAFGTVFLFKELIEGLNQLLLTSLFSNYLNEIEYTIVFSMPIYIPFIVLIFFVFFTLLFARGSMSKIAKTDPMAVISEVA
jgi:ABC-type antimicrobial peptide transport system permease subunit